MFLLLLQDFHVLLDPYIIFSQDGATEETNEGSSDEERETTSKGKRKQLRGSAETNNDKQKSTGKKRKMSAKKTTTRNLTQPADHPADGADMEDVVQDFQFSSDED